MPEGTAPAPLAPPGRCPFLDRFVDMALPLDHARMAWLRRRLTLLLLRRPFGTLARSPAASRPSSWRPVARRRPRTRPSTTPWRRSRPIPWGTCWTSPVRTAVRRRTAAKSPSAWRLPVPQRIMASPLQVWPLRSAVIRGGHGWFWLMAGLSLRSSQFVFAKDNP